MLSNDMDFKCKKEHIKPKIVTCTIISKNLEYNLIIMNKG